MSDQPEIVVYSAGWCPYCAAARELLTSKGVAFEEIDLTEHPQRRAEMQARSGRHTVPQIFIGDRHIGGFDDIDALERKGELDELLGKR